MTGAYAVTFAAAGGAGAGVVGGKGASLGELARAGVAVPPGFVITVAAFAAAMAVIDPDDALRGGIEALEAGDMAGIARVASGFREIVAAAPLPAEVAAATAAGYAALAGPGEHGASAASVPDVAVRSSATVEDSAEASFAGLQDTYLGVSGAASVLDHVRRCWASLYNDESVAYRRRLGLPEADVAMAVVVQRMVAPRAAGVMFTRSPVTGDRSVVAIEGTWGLGSALVSGDVTPDSWAISKITGEITGRRVSAKARLHRYAPDEDAPADPPGGARVTVADMPAGLRDAPCLTDDEIRALAAVARRVEAHYGSPQDIEWAVLDAPFAQAPAGSAVTGAPVTAAPVTAAAAESRVVLLQSRPETVWASRDAKPAGAPKPRAADHVLSLFGKPL
jgi:pyruvate, water dikinase